MKVEYEDLTIEQAKSALCSGEKVQTRYKAGIWGTLSHSQDVSDTCEYRRVIELKDEFNPAVGEEVYRWDAPRHEMECKGIFLAEFNDRYWVIDEGFSHADSWDNIAPVEKEKKPLTDIEKAIEELEKATEEIERTSGHRIGYIMDRIYVAIEHLKRAENE